MSTLISKQYATKILEHIPTMWPTLKVALLTDAPSVSEGTIDVSLVEVDGASYRRVSIPAADWTEPLGNAPTSMLLDKDIVFPENTESTPWFVSWAAIMGGDGDNALIAIQLITEVIVPQGQELRIASGLLALRHLTI